MTINKKRFIQITSFSLTLYIAIMIFVFSSKTAEVSANQSMRITELLLFWMKEDQLIKYNQLIRKYAHFFIYFCFELSLIFSLKFLNLKLKSIYKISIIIVGMYAILDEFHQLFVDGRGAQLNDIIIDFFGAISAIVIYWVVTTIREYKLY